MRVKRSAVAFLVLAAILLVAGCGGKPDSAKQTAAKSPAPASSNTTTPSTPAEPAKASVKVNLAVGGKASIMYLPPAIAEYAGFFKDQGIDIQVQDLKGGAQAAQALATGEVDFASVAVEHAVKYKAQGVDMVMLALYTRYPAITLVVDSKLKDKVKSISDLKGMKVGITSAGSATHKALLSLMDKAGMKSTDIEAVGVGTDGVIDAFAQGKVSAAFGLDPWVTQLVNEGKAFILTDLRTKKDTEALYGGDYPLVGFMTRRDVIEKNPELVQKMVKAITAGTNFVLTKSPEEVAAKLPAEIKGKDEALYIQSLKANIDAFAPGGIATDTGLQIVIDSLKKDKVIPDTMTIKPGQVFDGTFARK